MSTQPSQIDNADYLLQYHADNPKVRAAILYVIGRLPAEVREFALDRCRFISVGETTFARSLPSVMLTYRKGQVEGQTWVIVLTEICTDLELEVMIAHEIAHGWHHANNIHDPETTAEERVERDIARWGFPCRP